MTPTVGVGTDKASEPQKQPLNHARRYSPVGHSAERIKAGQERSRSQRLPLLPLWGAALASEHDGPA
ncbi:hypothetical protein GCM10010329_72910 [Streptomyces spiroverticillatus]|uniref:Uncharacterized protein n=1 Tax=Streptomyces finlayi TaxID=67296 RepID=A0A918X6G5_9ACTN|nr:hypothetical protein GCM10010329_72910 [Streptomyces spiroverticillatus]GHD14145.1 hypothetical protein GCM10010334_73070 [Streptomyces finlayi]